MSRHNMQLSTLVIITLSLLTIPLIFFNKNQIASAVSTQKSLSIVLLGDSYTAGNGAGSYIGQKGSYQSRNSWGNRYAAWLNAQGVKTTLTNLSHSGKTAIEIRNEQIEKVPANTNLVMLTAGGNDAKFEDVVKQCFAKGFRDDKGCRESVEFATSNFPAIISKTNEIFKNLEDRLSPSAQVVLVGYPLLSLDKPLILERCAVFDETIKECVKYTQYDASREVRKAGQQFNNLQKSMVDSWNTNSDLKVTFVDTIQGSFNQREPDPQADTRNPKRWINEFFESEGIEKVDGGGEIQSRLNLDQNNFYHPNITGHSKIAADIINKVGVPDSAKPIAKTEGNVDIAFVVDTTGSMSGAINQVKQNINDISYQIQQTTNSARFALVDFQDHPAYGGGYYDYPARLRLDFTPDQTKLALATYDLQVGDGGDWKESVLSGAMTALNLDWRPGVRKIMIIIGDAPAKDPEPITSYTWQQVAQKAYEVDPVEAYAIDVSGASFLSNSIKGLIEQSGGQVLSGSNITQSIIDSVEHSTAKPFGWIQGPYVIKQGESLELDARASYAVDSSIEKIDWDLDGNGDFETPSEDLLLSHQFDAAFSGTIGVRITDSNGRVGFGSTQLDVTDDGDTVPLEADNCPLVANLSQIDADNDGKGDDCDDDIGWPTVDKEGLTVRTEERQDPVKPPVSSESCSNIFDYIRSKLNPKSTCKIDPITAIVNTIKQVAPPKSNPTQPECKKLSILNLFRNPICLSAKK